LGDGKRQKGEKIGRRIRGREGQENRMKRILNRIFLKKSNGNTGGEDSPAVGSVGRVSLKLLPSTISSRFFLRNVLEEEIQPGDHSFFLSFLDQHKYHQL
tara:strand:+ start:137 stop:436 length:300 start_codon:yes stop_codon:yes gene_type:complete